MLAFGAYPHRVPSKTILCGTGSEYGMDQVTRRDILRRYIRTAMMSDSVLLRYITVSWPVDSAESATVVSINGRTPGVIALSVRSASINDEGARRLTGAEFDAAYDEDNPRYTVYRRSAGRATIDDLVAFVEWVFLVVARAPEDYAPKVTPVSTGEKQKARAGCAKSCLTVAKVAFWLMLGLVVLITWLVK